MNNRHQKISLPALGTVALVIVGLIFFDIIFLNRTLQPSNIIPHMGKPAAWQASSAILPVFNPDAIASDGFADLNASAWQFEPARYWMARNFRERQSPWWNPYSASGTLGPETLVDIKFSPHTLITAWFFNASDTSFDFGLIAIYCLGVFFVLLVFQHIFQLGWLASMAGALVYLLNGFSLPNLNTHIGQPYFFSPILLFAVLFFAQRQSLWRWIFLVFSHAILLTVNILTTLSLVLITVHLLGLVLFILGSRCHPLSGFLRYSTMVFSAVLTALMLVAPLWFQIVNSFFVTDMVMDFDSRTKWGWAHSVDSMLSIFTPRHFWDAGGHVPGFSLYPQAGLERNNNLIAYLGVVASLIASCAFSNTQRQYRAVIWMAWALLVLSCVRVFGFAAWIEYIPVIRSIGGQYWGCVAAVVMPLLVAFGLQNIRLGKVSVIPLLLLLLLQWMAFVWLWWRLGWPTVSLYSHYVTLVLLLGVLSVFLLLMLRWKFLNATVVTICLLVVMSGEMLSYMNTVRPLRYSPIKEVPEFINFLKENIADGRVLNIGQEGVLYPEYGAMFGIKQADTQNPGLFPWYEKFFEAHFGNDTFMFLALDGSSDRKRKKSVRKEYTLDEKALDVAGIKYILVADGAKPYLNFLYGKNYPVVYQKEGLSIFENVDYVHSVSLEPISSAEDIPPQKIDGSANVVSYRNTEVIIETEANSPARLVLSDTWHPAWKASVDEQLIKIERVHEAFRGVVLPAGKHRVRMYYDPPALRYGIYAMMITASLLLLLLLLCLWQTRKTHER